MNDVEPADPVARRRALWTLGATAVFGAAAIMAFLNARPALQEWLDQDAAARPGRVRLAVGVLGLALAAPVAAMAVYVWRFGARVRAGERFPPAGTAVVRDTPILRGEAAERRGAALQWLAALVAAAAVTLLGLLWRLLG